MQYHKPPFRLKEIKIEVTHDCTLRCRHCSSLAEPGCNREMTPEQCFRILDEAASMGVTNVAFSGGEPLLWKALVEAVVLAANHGMSSDLYTTGNVPEVGAVLKRLADAGLGRVMFSIFATDSVSHEQVTTVHGSHSITLAAAKCCAELGIETEFHFVPLAHNLKELPNIAQLARNLGMTRISVLRLVPQGRGAEGEDMQLSKKQNVELRQMIESLRDDGHTIRLGSPYNFLMIRDDPKCCAAIDRLTIGPDLRIFPCDAFKHIPPGKIGVGSEYSSLSVGTLTECWEQSPYLEAVRHYLTTPFSSECSDCGALDVCLSGCMAQKIHANGNLCKCPDPMCLMQRSN